MANGTANGLLTDDERRILQDICDDEGVSCKVVEQMIAAESRVYGMGRRHGIWEILNPLVDEGVKGSGGQREEAIE